MNGVRGAGVGRGAGVVERGAGVVGRGAGVVALVAGSLLCVLALGTGEARAVAATPTPPAVGTTATGPAPVPSVSIPVPSVSTPVPTAGPAGSALRQASWVVWLDLEAGRLAVEQDVELTNPTSTAYAGQGSAPGLPADRHPVLRLPIARGGTDLQYVGQFEGCCAVVDGDSLVLSQPVKPGTSQGTVRYELAFTSRLDLTVPLPTENLVVLVHPGLHLDAPQLTASGTSTDRGVTYRAYRTSGLIPGTTVGLHLALAPASRSSTIGRWVAGAGGVVLALGGALFVLRRRRTGRRGRTPQAARIDRATRRTRAPAQERGEDAELLVEEIALLDLAFEYGAISDEAAYRRVRAAVLERLTAVQDADEPVRTETGRR